MQVGVLATKYFDTTSFHISCIRLILHHVRRSNFPEATKALFNTFKISRCRKATAWHDPLLEVNVIVWLSWLFMSNCNRLKHPHQQDLSALKMALFRSFDNLWMFSLAIRITFMKYWNRVFKIAQHCWFVNQRIFSQKLITFMRVFSTFTYLNLLFHYFTQFFTFLIVKVSFIRHAKSGDIAWYQNATQKAPSETWVHLEYIWKRAERGKNLK